MSYVSLLLWFHVVLQAEELKARAQKFGLKQSLVGGMMERYDPAVPPTQQVTFESR